MSKFYDQYNEYIFLPEIEIRSKILVLCEGASTEKNWLDEVKIKYKDVQIIDCGDHTLASYETLIKKILMEIGDYELTENDEVAYIFDLDVFKGSESRHTINHLEDIIENNHFNLFYTNEFFEFFLLLHYTNASNISSVTRLTKEEINEELVKKKLKNGTKTKSLNKNIKNIVETKTDLACQNSEFIETEMCNITLHSKPNIIQMNEILKIGINFSNIHKFIQLLEKNR